MESNIYSFEDKISAYFYYTNSSIKLSNKHFKDGKSSLKWEIEGRSSLGLVAPIGYKPFKEGSLDQARDSFVVWIYAEEAHPGETLRFDFLKQGERCAHFYFNLDFTGWRTAWVPYDAMEGEPITGMDELCITASMERACSLYLDQMILCVPIDPRHPTRDKQVPFVNVASDQAANSHWLSLYRFDTLKANALKSIKPEVIDIEAIEKITQRLEDYILSHSPYSEQASLADAIEKITLDYEKYNIRVGANGIRGTIINAACHTAAFPKQDREELINLTAAIDIKETSKWMLAVAYGWHKGNPDQKELLARMFINFFRHLLDQGWGYGSSMGTTHHLGYPMRPYYDALFLMRQPLKEAGYLEEASKAMEWFSGCGRIFREDHEIQSESMDTLNTLLQGILSSILTMDSKKEVDLCLKAMQHWLSTCMQPAPGLVGPFKADGSTYHHCNHYPAYAMGGFTGAAPVVYVLSQTPYQLGKLAHETMRKSLLYMRLYCNHTDWLVSMSARHPKGIGPMAQISTLEPFYYMALAGTPGDTDKVDKEMAEALLRLAKHSDYPEGKTFTDMGLKAETDPSGHFTMNYACSTLHRRDHWLAGVRGHSRYIWGNETYLHNNLYGRYMAYGNLQILGGGSPVNNKESGYYQEGWDWNCWPGTTTVHLPLEDLKANVCNVDTLSGFEEMLLSDETYAGGTSIGGENGMFAMKLHSHAKYDHSHRARKSYFFFDNRIVCIGTGIENDNRAHETRTTLFQSYLKDESDPIYINSLDPVVGYETDFVSDKGPLWLKDNVGNSYYIPYWQTVKVTRSVQSSRSQDLDEPTQAPFAKAWIDHGTRPNDESYEYMIVVNDDNKDPHKLKVQDAYEVVQADHNAHIVQDKKTGILGYAFYEPCDAITAGVVKKVDRSSLVMEQMKGDRLHLSVCDPDLRLYEGKEEDQYNLDGTQKEVSLYSRKWRKNPSVGKDLYVTLDGYWHLVKPQENVWIQHEKDRTIITIHCIEARPVEMELKN